jgi:hypothetical protein
MQTLIPQSKWPVETKHMKIKSWLIAYAASLALMPLACGGEIKGKVSYATGENARALVTVGVIRDAQRPYLSASVDALINQLGVETDASGNFRLINVAEGVPLMVMVEIVGQAGPSFNRTLTLQSGSVIENFNFTVPKFTATTVKLKGKVTINGSPSAEDIAGSAAITSTDGSIGDVAYFGRADGGAYFFNNLPSGNYVLTAEVPNAPGSETTKAVSSNVIIPASGDVTVDLNIQLP